MKWLTNHLIKIRYDNIFFSKFLWYYEIKLILLTLEGQKPHNAIY